MSGNNDHTDTPTSPGEREVSRQSLLQDGAARERSMNPIAVNPPLDRATRRSILGGLSAVAAGSLIFGMASAEDRDPEEVPTPDVEGPITGGIRTGEPENSAPRDVSQWGYVEEEYFLSGEAMALNPDPLPTRDEFGETAEYATRMIVWRPEDMDGSGPPFGQGRGRGPSDDGFSGTVVLNWPNVTLQRDNPVTIMNDLEYMAQHGHVGISFSAQKQGVDGSPLGFKNWDPVRYEGIEHPGDEYSFDMFSQCAKVLKDGPGDRSGQVDPLQGHRAERIFACGTSQSASRLTTYVNHVQELHGLIDGFMPQHSSSVTDIRDDLAPVLWFNSEAEVPSERADGDQLVVWEQVGSSHVNNYTSQWSRTVLARDHGHVVGAGADVKYNGGSEWDEANAGQYGELGSEPCGGSNLSPVRYGWATGIARLEEWVEDGTRPPSQPRVEVDENGNIEYDEHRNGIGGYRLPTIDTPIATYEDSCFRMGAGEQVQQFDNETLHKLYPTHDDYIAALEDEVEGKIDDRLLVPWAADDLLRRARRSDIPEGEPP